MIPAILAEQDRLLRALTPEQKLYASEALRSSAWELKAAWVRFRGPGLADWEVREVVGRIFADARA